MRPVAVPTDLTTVLLDSPGASTPFDSIDAIDALSGVLGDAVDRNACHGRRVPRVPVRQGEAMDFQSQLWLWVVILIIAVGCGGPVLVILGMCIA